jgi:pimeloyl-ACP methyl ester carboxylesterase
MAPSVAEDLRWRTSMARIERRACTPRAAAHYMSVNLQVDVREVLSTVRVATIVLHCRGDRVYPLAQGRYVADHIDGARLVELDGRDHLFFAENVERVSEEIEAFVTGTPAGGTVDRGPGARDRARHRRGPLDRA